MCFCMIINQHRCDATEKALHQRTSRSQSELGKLETYRAMGELPGDRVATPEFVMVGPDALTFPEPSESTCFSLWW